ncbi:unnamed protein product [Lactuca saligna]|uniref:Ubiquitin-like protease family profile domain-containing protein n=1 Tax=Lactuca saligna TaxID=75948 RepID=A0AA35Z976_LACSI|nr:unnamed protein product [Lactuca saligna]
MSQGDWVPEPGEDSLTAVLGREHPGRTRAVGHTVCPRKAMHDSNKQVVDNVSPGVTKQVAEVKAMMHESNKQVVDNVSPGFPNSSCDSMPALVAITIIVNLHLISRVKNKCSFLNPHRILGADCQENPEAVINYIVDEMRINQGKQFLIAPYLQSEHWVLFVISPHNRTGYILDSIRSPIQKPMDTYYLLKKQVDTAFARYKKDTSNPISWTLAECNQQPGDWECRYYVMK